MRTPWIIRTLQHSWVCNPFDPSCDIYTPPNVVHTCTPVPVLSRACSPMWWSGLLMASYRARTTSPVEGRSSDSETYPLDTNSGQLATKEGSKSTLAAALQNPFGTRLHHVWPSQSYRSVYLSVCMYVCLSLCIDCCCLCKLYHELQQFSAEFQ